MNGSSSFEIGLLRLMQRASPIVTGFETCRTVAASTIAITGFSTIIASFGDTPAFGLVVGSHRAQPRCSEDDPAPIRGCVRAHTAGTVAVYVGLIPTALITVLDSSRRPSRHTELLPADFGCHSHFYSTHFILIIVCSCVQEYQYIQILCAQHHSTRRIRLPRSHLDDIPSFPYTTWSRLMRLR